MLTDHYITNEERSFIGWYRSYLKAERDREYFIEKHQALQQKLCDSLKEEAEKAAHAWMNASGKTPDEIRKAAEEVRLRKCRCLHQ